MDPINDKLSSIFDDIGLSQKPPEAKKKGLDQEAFLTLMLTQLKNQSPLEPIENGEFIAQMAQFSSASGINELKQSFDNFAVNMQSSQALQASSLVGRDVLVNSNQGMLEPNGKISGQLEVEVPLDNLTLNIYNSNGELVRQLEYGSQNPGNIHFDWDGTDADGNLYPPGSYLVQAQAKYNNANYTLDTMMEARVSSVTIGQQGLILNLADSSSISLSQIKEIR